jgi:hypothetical protein
MYSFWAPDDGQRNRLKHVEHFAEINELCNVASCWLYAKTFAMNRPLNVKLIWILTISWWGGDICPTEQCKTSKQIPYIMECMCVFLIHFSHNKVHIISCFYLTTCSQLTSAIRAYSVSKDWTGHSWYTTLYACTTHSPLILYLGVFFLVQGVFL